MSRRLEEGQIRLDPLLGGFYEQSKTYASTDEFAGNRPQSFSNRLSYQIRP